MTLSEKDVRSRQHDLGLTSLWYFANALCKKTFTKEAHGDIIAALEKGDFDEILLLMARGHYKTHLVATYYAWRIVKDRNVRILNVSATYAVAKKVLTLTRSILELPAITSLYGSFCGPIWSTEELIVSGRTQAHRESTLTISGMESFQPGGHYDLVGFEDIENQESVNTPELREKTRMVDSLAYPMTDEPGAKRLTTGTIYHEADLYCTKITQNHLGTLVRGEDGIERTVYVNGTVRTVEIDDPDSDNDGLTGKFIFFYKPWKKPDGSFLLPERFNRRKEARIRARMSAGDVAKQYELDPKGSTKKPFPRDLFVYVPEAPKGTVFHVLGADFASSTRIDSDYCGFAVVAFDREAKSCVVHAEKLRLNVDQQHEYLFSAWNRWPNLWYALEEDNFVRGWRPQFEVKCRQRGLYTLVTTKKNDATRRVMWMNAHARGEKKEGIQGAIEGPLRSGSMTFLSAAQICEEQGDSFPNGADDVLDALRNAMQRVREAPDPDLFLHLESRDDSRETEWAPFKRRGSLQPYSHLRGDRVPWKAS